MTFCFLVQCLGEDKKIFTLCLDNFNSILIIDIEPNHPKPWVVKFY